MSYSAFMILLASIYISPTLPERTRMSMALTATCFSFGFLIKELSK